MKPFKYAKACRTNACTVLAPARAAVFFLKPITLSFLLVTHPWLRTQRKQRAMFVLRRRKSNFGMHAGKQLPVGVGHLNLGEQGARRRIKSASGPHNSCVEGLVWNFSERHPRV